MRRSEALAELELGEYATAAEIKAAYRDLVKVWHPDRFGGDARLRQRAEERLQRINEAYRRLESGEFAPETIEPAAPSHPSEVRMGRPKIRVRTRAERDAARRGWVYLALVVMVGAFAGYAVVEHARAAREPSDMAAPATAAAPATPSASAEGDCEQGCANGGGDGSERDTAGAGDSSERGADGEDGDGVRRIRAGVATARGVCAHADGGDGGRCGFAVGRT